MPMYRSLGSWSAFTRRRRAQVSASKKLLASNPKAVAGLVRAVNTGMIAIAKDQNAGMKAAVNYDNLINADVEKRRLQYSFDKLIH